MNIGPAHVTVPSAVSVTGSEGRQPGDRIPPCCPTILRSAAGVDGRSDPALAVDDIGFEGQSPRDSGEGSSPSAVPPPHAVLSTFTSCIIQVFSVSTNIYQAFVACFAMWYLLEMEDRLRPRQNTRGLQFQMTGATKEG